MLTNLRYNKSTSTSRALLVSGTLKRKMSTNALYYYYYTSPSESWRDGSCRIIRDGHRNSISHEDVSEPVTPDFPNISLFQTISRRIRTISSSVSINSTMCHYYIDCHSRTHRASLRERRKTLQDYRKNANQKHTHTHTHTYTHTHSQNTKGRQNKQIEEQRQK